MVDTAIANLKPEQFKSFEEDYKEYIGHGINKKGIYSYITIEFRSYQDQEV
jgi:hypothetical protein